MEKRKGQKLFHSNSNVIELKLYRIAKMASSGRRCSILPKTPKPLASSVQYLPKDQKQDHWQKQDFQQQKARLCWCKHSGHEHLWPLQFYSSGAIVFGRDWLLKLSKHAVRKCQSNLHGNLVGAQGWRSQKTKVPLTNPNVKTEFDALIWNNESLNDNA